MGTLDEIGYMPTAEELEAGKTWGELVKQKENEFVIFDTPGFLW